MDIIVKGRRTSVSDKFRRHVDTKLAKLAKWEHKGMSVDVEVSKERNPKLADHRERVELTVHTSGPVIRGESSADDRYAALDLALDRVESRLRKSADRRKIHRGNHSPISVAAATAEQTQQPTTGPRTGMSQEAPATPVHGAAQATATLTEGEPAEAPTTGEEPADGFVELDTQGEAPVIVREKFHHAKPMSIDQALMEMELVGHDFYLFHDEECDAPSVVYRRKGFDYGVLRLVE